MTAKCAHATHACTTYHICSVQTQWHVAPFSNGTTSYEERAAARIAYREHIRRNMRVYIVCIYIDNIDYGLMLVVCFCVTKPLRWPPPQFPSYQTKTTNNGVSPH